MSGMRHPIYQLNKEGEEKTKKGTGAARVPGQLINQPSTKTSALVINQLICGPPATRTGDQVHKLLKHYLAM